MSTEVMTWVWKHSRAGGTDRLVLLAIADCANDDGLNAFPSVKTLAKKALVSERTVQRSIQALADLGELLVASVGSGRVSSRYRVVMAVPQDEGCQAVTPQPEQRHAGEGRQVVTPAVSSRHPRGDTGVGAGVTRVSPEPFFNRPGASKQAGEPDPGINPKLTLLQAALAAAGIPVAPPPDEVTCRRVTDLIDRSGIPALVISARSQWQPGSPARFMTAFVALWSKLAPLPAASPTSLGSCAEHGAPLTSTGVCPGCRAEQLAAR